jgi:hypothetical protein
VAFKLLEERIVPGGLNLLTPTDQTARHGAMTDVIGTPQGDSLDLTDWWPAADGKLEQSPAPATLSSQGYVDSVMRTGSNTYSSGNGNVYLAGSSIDSGYGSVPVGMIAFQGYAWFTSQAKQSKHDGTALTDWTPPAPTVAPTLTDMGPQSGFKLWPVEDSYCITWVFPKIGESNPGPTSQLTVGANPDGSQADVEGHTIRITRTETAPSGATGWNIYRRVPGYGGASLDANTAFYVINSEPIPTGTTTTTFDDTGHPIDNLDDTNVLRFGQLLEANHDAAPAAAVMANQTFNGRIIVANSAAHPNRMWWTPALQPAFFRGSGDDFGGDWVDVGTDTNDEIRAITVRPGLLVIYRAKSIWRQIGDFDDVNVLLEPACPDTGIAGPRAVASTAAADYFVSNGGDAVYAFNNDWPTKISQRIEPLLRGLPTENFSSQNTGQAGLCAIGHRRGRLYVSYTPSGATLESFILHLESGRWFACSGIYRAFQDTRDYLLAGSPTGVFQLEAGYAAASALAFQSQYLDCGLPDHQKTWADLVLVHNTRGVTMTITCRTNKWRDTNNDSFVLGTFNSNSLTKQIFQLIYPATYPITALQGLPIKAFNLSIRITGSGAAAGVPVTIESPILLHYYLEARQGLSFDTGNTNHGLEGAGMIDQIEIDADSTGGAVVLKIFSDLPGGVIVDRTSGGISIPASSGRQVLRVVLPNPIWGRLFREQVWAPVPFQIYGFKVRIVPIGVYIDGSQGDFWYTLAQSLVEA